MNDCGQDKITDLGNIRFSAKILQMLRYLKEPVEVISELYNRYPDGGEWGWFAIVTSLNTIAVWNVKDKIWQPINAFGDFVQSDWEETDEQAAAYIKNKPDLTTITTNEPYNKYFTDILTANGVYEIHASKNLMYSNGITHDLQLVQGETHPLNESYGTTYMLFTNTSDKDIKIEVLRNDSNSVFAIGFNMDEPLVIAPHEWIEIAVKRYTDLSIVTCVYGNGIVIPEQVQADWEEKDKNAKSFIRNKPDLEKLGVNEEYTNVYNDIITNNGDYYVHPHKNLMYQSQLKEDIVLSEILDSMTIPLYGTTYMLFENITDNDIKIGFHKDLPTRLTAIGFDIDEPLLLTAKSWIEIAVKGYGYNHVVTCISGIESGSRIKKEFYSEIDNYPFSIVSGNKIFVHPVKEYNGILKIDTDNTVFVVGGVTDEFYELTPDQLPEGYDINKCLGTT